MFYWLFPKPVKRMSNINTYLGSQYELSRCYDKLIDNPNIEITSVSVTRVDHSGMNGYVDKYLIAVSYNYTSH